MEAVNRRKEVIGTLRLNIYTIWIGPYHIDFLMELKGSSTCRINFNFRISQGLELKLENTYTEMIPIQPKVEGTRLTFTMEAIVLTILSRLAKKPNHLITLIIFV